MEIDAILALSTIALTIVSCMLTWVTWLVYKTESNHMSEVSTNALDNMKDVAIASMSHDERIRQMKRIRRTI